MKEQETWEENSIEARLQKLQAAIEALSNALIDSGIASWFIDLGTTAASGLEGLIDGVGTLSTLVTTLGIALGATNFGFLQFNEDGSSTNIVKEFIGNISGFKKSNYNMNKTFVDEFKKAYNANSSSVNIGDIFTNNSKLDKNKINNTVLKTAQGLADGVIDELGTLDESFNNTVGSANKFGSSIKQFFGNLGISLAIGIAISTIEKLITSYDNMIAKAQEATNKFNEQKATISDYKTQISSLREEIASGTLSYSETLEKNKELLEIQNDLVETYGAQAKGIDLVNGSLKEQNDILDSINEKNRQQWENEVNDLSDASDIWNYVTSGSKFIYKGITSPSLFNIPTQIERVGEAFENIENYGISSDVLEESFQILIDYQDTATEFWGTNIDQIRDKVENFNKSFDLTNVKVLNDYIESFDNITKVGDAFEISGNVEDVVDTITTIQTELEGITGYNDEIDQQLTKIANDAQDIIDNHLSTYYDIIENDIMKDDGLSEYYKQLTEAYLAYQQSVEDGESEDLQEKKLNDYSSILNEIITNGSISESIKNYFINLYPDIQSIVDSWVLSPKIEAQVSDIEGISLFDNYSKDEILALDKERLSEASTLTEKEKQELEKLHELAEDSGLNLDLYLAKLYELGKVQEGIYKINQHFGYGNKETWQTEQAEKFLDNAKQFETANKTKQTNQSANKSNSGLNSFNLLPDERNNNVSTTNILLENNLEKRQELINRTNEETEAYQDQNEVLAEQNELKALGIDLVPSLAPVDKKQTVTVEEQNNQNINKALQKYAEENAEDFKIGLEFDEDFSSLDGYLDFAKKAKGNTEEWTNAYGETYEILTDEAILECIEKWIEKAKEAKSVTEKVTTSYKDLATSLNTLQGDFSGDDSKFQEALGKIQKGQPVDSTIIDSFSDEIKGLSGFEGFTRSMMDVSKTADEQKKALEKLATEYLMQSGLVKNITEDNKEYVISELTKMNITNASAIAEQALIERYGAEKYAIQELVNYHVKLGETKYTTATASAELENATLSEIYSMIEEAEAAGQNTAALRQMLVEKVKACQVTLATDGDISNLKKLVKTLGGTTEAFEAYARLKAEVNSGKWDSNPTEAQVQLAYYREQMKIASNAVLKQDVEMDTNVSLNYNPTTDKSSSTDSTKEEAGEVFDFIEIRLQNLMDMASKAKDKIDDLLSFGSKRKQTIQAINKTTKAIKAEIKAAKEYAKYADKVAKEAASDTSTSSTEKITSTVGKTIAQEAQKYVGVLPYVYGGKSLTSGADCSGFVQSLYAQYGISIPRVSSDQWNDSNATYVAKEDLQAGDLVFFASGGSASNPGHVGLYIGNGKMVHEPQEGEKAKISSIDWVDYVGGKHYASLGNSYGTNTTTTTKKTYSNKELERYKKLVRQGLISDDAIKTIKDENLSKAISDYKDWYEKSQDCIESIETLTDSLKELYETLAQNPIEKAADRVEDLDNAIELRNAQQENLKVSQTKQYKNLNDKNITAYKKEEKAYKTASDTTDKKYNSAVKEANKAQKSALKLAKKVKAKNSGLTVAELKKVRSILKAGTKEIPAKYLAKMTNQKLINKCLDYNEALIAETKMEEAKETANQNYALAKETTKRQTAELQKDTFDQFQEDYENKIYEKERKSQQAQNKLDLREAQGKYASAKQLKIQLSAEEDKLKLLEEEETKLRTQLKLIPEGTPEWYEAKEALAGVVDEQNECLITQEEINDAINNIPIDKLNDAIEEFESLRSVISSTIELLEKRYRNVSSSLYEKDIEYIKGEISKNKGLAELYRRQYEEEVAKGNDQAASEALVNWKNAESTSNSLYSAMEDTYDAIWQNELSAYENIATKIEYAQSNIQSLLGIIQDEMLVDNDTGELTDYGLAKESLYLEQFGNANEEVSTYKAELAELEEMWANGQSGLSENEYLEKKAELYQNLTDAVNDQVSAVQALIDITEQQMQAELNALKEVIDARVEALNEKKAYYDYDKNIRSQTKDIQSLDNQIAALKSAEDTYENRKELKLLEAQRQEAQEQLDETQLDHQIELLTNGLNDFYDEISEEYDDYIQELKSSTEAQHELVQTIKGAVASVPEIIEQATEAALATYGLQGTNILRDTDWQKSVPEQQVTKEEEIQPDLSVLDDENTDSTNSSTTAVNTNTTAVNTNTTAVNDLTTAINSLNSSGSGNVESVTLDAKAVYFGAVASEVTGGGITGSVDWSGTAKFATGGIVRSGISDRTNDKLLVRVNPDETILTKDFTDMLPTTVDIMKDLVKMPTVVPTTYSNSPVVNVSYDNLIRIDGNADSNTIAEVKKLMPEIVRQTSTSIARQMKRNGF